MNKPEVWAITYVLQAVMAWQISPVQNSEIVLYWRLIRLKNVVAVGKRRESTRLLVIHNTGIITTRTHRQILVCQWVNDRKKICYCHILLRLVRTHLKIVYAMLSGKSESHAHTLIPITTSFKRCFCFTQRMGGGFDKHSPKTDRYFCCKVKLLHSLIHLHNSGTKQRWGL